MEILFLLEWRRLSTLLALVAGCGLTAWGSPTQPVSPLDDQALLSYNSDCCNAAPLTSLTAMTPKFPLVDNMRRHGGNFVSKLADAMVAADPVNFDKLCAAFPDIVEKYSELVAS